MIVGIKRDRVMGPVSLADVNNCGFDYIGSLCAKINDNFKLLPDVNISGFGAKKLGHAYCVCYGHALDEPDWALRERDITNLDIFVKRKREKENKRCSFRRI